MDRVVLLPPTSSPRLVPCIRVVTSLVSTAGPFPTIVTWHRDLVGDRFTDRLKPTVITMPVVPPWHVLGTTPDRVTVRVQVTRLSSGVTRRVGRVPVSRALGMSLFLA